MSGLGRIERAILMLVDNGEADFYALKDLANWIYHRDRPATYAQQQSVCRAAHSLARKFPERLALVKDESGDLLWVTWPADARGTTVYTLPPKNPPAPSLKARRSSDQRLDIKFGRRPRRRHT